MSMQTRERENGAVRWDAPHPPLDLRVDRCTSKAYMRIILTFIELASFAAVQRLKEGFERG
jgi:hypothetical protein